MELCVAKNAQGLPLQGWTEEKTLDSTVVEFFLILSCMEDPPPFNNEWPFIPGKITAPKSWGWGVSNGSKK